VPIVHLPWGAWFDDGQQPLHLSDRWACDVLQPRRAAACPAEAILRACRQPVESPPLRDLAAGVRTACIAVDDLARPTKHDRLLPPLLNELHEGGLPVEGIRIVVALGSHGAPTEPQLVQKLGAETCARYDVTCHDCRAGLAGTGIRYGDQELRINRTFFESELKIAVGSVLPHSFAGYSGGAKLVLPGLADLAATARSHKFVQLGLRGGGDPSANRFRSEAEDIARRLGLRFVVCAVVNSDREAAAVFAGDVVAAHRQACAAAERNYATTTTGDYDCLVLNAWPKDIDLLQADNAFVALKSAATPLVREGGLYVLTTAASEGLGRHGLFEPGGVSYRTPQPKRGLAGRDLWIYAPTVPPEQTRQLYWDGYRTFTDRHQLEQALNDRWPARARIGVVTCAPMQQLRLAASERIQPAT
jgi:nickel-dependent lactate racemase